MARDTALRAGVIVLLAGAVCMCPRMAQAAAPGYEIQIGVAESDNIQRLPSGGTDETIGNLELGFIWHDKRPLLTADIDADLSQLYYFRHTYADNVVGNFIGQLQFNLVPEVLSWNFVDNFGQAPLNLLAPNTPDNYENINYFDTGPTLTLPLGRATQLDVTGEYGRVNYQHLDLDNTRLTGGVGLLHQMSPVSTISINARDERIEYTNDQLNPDYDRQSAFARLDIEGSRTGLGVDLGYSRLRMTGAPTGTLLARLEITRRISATSTIGVAFGHDYSDGADAFRLVQALGGATLNTQPTLQVGAPFVDTYGTLAWNFQRARTTLNFSASYFRDRYQTDTLLSNDRAVANARVERQITPTLRVALTEYAVRQQFLSGGGNSTVTNTALLLTWGIGRRLSLFLGYNLAKESSDVRAYEYTENRLSLSIGYGRAADIPAVPLQLRLPAKQ